MCVSFTRGYGLKQAPQAWYSEIRDYLFSLGFKMSNSDHCLFICSTAGVTLYLVVYVDDLIVTGNDIKFINQFISKLGHRFSIKDLGSLNYFLGVKVVRADHGLFLSQQKYIEDIVDRTLMTSVKPVPTPLAVGNSLSLNDSALLDNPSEYRTIVGSLQYLGLTRLDIAFAVNKLAQFFATPTVNHWAAVKRVIRYLIGTIDKGLQFHHHSSLVLHAFSDSDWGGDKDDRSSTLAYVVFLGKNPISWSSKKQRVVAKSSTEAEYRSISATASELCWIHNLLLELAVSLSKPPVIYCDNLGATYVTTKPIFHSRMKHLEIDYHFVRQLVQLGKLRVSHISSQDQLADVLTKALPRSDFGCFLSKIGVSDQPPS
ncbi:hypothetical protein GH714_026508 [Hevea brasiliensis]|uniref:Reverse transcriptase Ty1/copia-type domain-containing protein n=1 Tax=Hevea brasiliensis TaxID=3981 RepID=A0A6A6NCI6_HEVBR|nr:hypothetical protein GH714_026508 [Hevea brasiliensis]